MSLQLYIITPFWGVVSPCQEHPPDLSQREWRNSGRPGACCWIARRIPSKTGPWAAVLHYNGYVHESLNQQNGDSMGFKRIYWWNGDIMGYTMHIYIYIISGLWGYSWVLFFLGGVTVEVVKHVEAHLNHIAYAKSLRQKKKSSWFIAAYACGFARLRAPTKHWRNAFAAKVGSALSSKSLHPKKKKKRCSVWFINRCNHG